MLHIDNFVDIKIAGSNQKVMFELAQLLVSYQYVIDNATNKKASLNSLLDTVCSITDIAAELYNDPEYREILKLSDTRIVDVTSLNKALHKIEEEDK